MRGGIQRRTYAIHRCFLEMAVSSGTPHSIVKIVRTKTGDNRNAFTGEDTVHFLHYRAIRFVYLFQSSGYLIVIAVSVGIQ